MPWRGFHVDGTGAPDANLKKNVAATDAVTSAALVKATVPTLPAQAALADFRAYKAGSGRSVHRRLRLERRSFDRRGNGGLGRRGWNPGRLLLIHGAMDDNVHPQNTMRFARALQRAEKSFELMIYPGARHGIGGGHYNRMTFDFIREAMGVMPQPSTAPADDQGRAARH